MVDIKIDCSVDIKPLNRYLLKVVTKKYTYSQKIKSIDTTYSVQWQNIASDLKHLFSTEWGLRYGFGLAGFYIFIKTGNPLFLIFQGALALDSATTSNDTATFNVTVAANSDRMMIMGFGHYQAGNNISGATFDSVALTELKAQAGSFGERAGLWGLVAPNTGTKSFVISGNDSWTGYGVISVYNVDQTLPATTGGASGDSSSASASLTTTVDNAWVVGAFGCEAVPTMSTSGGTEDMKLQGASYQNAEMHHVNKATAGSQTVSCSLSYGSRWNVALCQLKPVAAAASTFRQYRTMQGIGI